MSITISNCDEDKFLNAVRIDGLLKYNMEKTNGKLKIPNLEIIRGLKKHRGGKEK